MYTMVLMMAMAGSDDVASFGGRKNKSAGCNGAQVVATNGCSGYSAYAGASPYTGCTGQVAYAPAYSGCTGTVANSGCSGSTSCNGSKSGGFLGLRSGGGGFLGHRNKDKGNGCSGSSSCYGSQSAYSGYSTGCSGHQMGYSGYSTGCTGGMIVGYPATGAVAMPAVGTTGEKPAEPKKPDPKPTETKKSNEN